MANELIGNWSVRIKATVTKIVDCKNCTKQQAHDDPFEHAVDETEVGQDDYEVIDVVAE